MSITLMQSTECIFIHRKYAHSVHRLLQNFTEDVEKELRGVGLQNTEVDISHLTHGARINRLFNERFPDLIAQVRPR